MLFVGTEPAIKVACDHNSKNTLVLATPSTISSERTHELVEKNQKLCIKIIKIIQQIKSRIIYLS